MFGTLSQNAISRAPGDGLIGRFKVLKQWRIVAACVAPRAIALRLENFC